MSAVWCVSLSFWWSGCSQLS